MRSIRRLALPLCLALLAAACGGDGDGEGGGGTDDSTQGELVAQVASYDLAAGSPTRFIVGLLTPDNLFVTGGTAELRFSYLPEGDAAPEPGGSATASFLSLPGDDHEHEEHAHPGDASHARGVYVAEGVTFDRAGFWQVEAVAEVEGTTRAGTAAFEVLEQHQVPAVGERAPRTENLVLPAKDAPIGALDSRAESEGEVPDRALHRTTIGDAVAAGSPALVVFSTPVYCISQFCGPITEMVEELAADYEDRATFIHVEIWRDFQNQVVNKAAADWLLHGESLQEPWVFLIGADGRIDARWDNVATRGEIEPLLEELPPIG